MFASLLVTLAVPRCSWALRTAPALGAEVGITNSDRVAVGRALRQVNDRAIPAEAHVVDLEALPAMTPSCDSSTGANCSAAEAVFQLNDQPLDAAPGTPFSVTRMSEDDDNVGIGLLADQVTAVFAALELQVSSHAEARHACPRARAVFLTCWSARWA